ncbi:hypothetical protein B0H19DRAFT_1264547 [Mycena capillaripes]|nr:hypothetical protein B0H19DRAFT_1264547 [Mycena capillaripes]
MSDGMHFLPAESKIMNPASGYSERMKTMKLRGYTPTLCLSEFVKDGADCPAKAFKLQGQYSRHRDHVYAKIEGKDKANALIWVNETVCRGLKWFADHVEQADGVFLIKTINYDPDEANIVSTGGMGFYIPALFLAFQSDLSAGISEDLKIFFYEALCVCAAIHQAATHSSNSAAGVKPKSGNSDGSKFRRIQALFLYVWFKQYTCQA